jgi:glycosyltransferase involved in cell wall biosynthesis
MPLVSVVIPSRDRPVMLREAVESVVAQTHKNIEIIVVLTGATDQTKLSAERLSTEYGVRLLETAPRNLAATRNNGLAIANGEWVSFLDDDDLWDSSKIERQLAVANETNADVVSTNWKRFDRAGNIELWRSKGAIPWPKGLSIPEALTVHNFISVGCLIWTDAIRSLGGFDESMSACEDWDMWRRLSHQHKIEYLDEYLMFVRVHDRNMSGNPWLMYRSSTRHLWKMRRDTPPHLRHMMRRQWKTFIHLSAFLGYELANRLTRGKTRIGWLRLKAMLK